MNIPTLAKWFASKPSEASRPKRRIRIGIPRGLNIWSTHQFWLGFFTALGIDKRDIVFSSETSEQQYREFSQGRGTVDCCYPVKCLVGHYGELLYGQKRKIDVLFSPMITTLPSFLQGHVADNLTCPRVMAAPENIKAGFLREKDIFAELGVRHVAPLVAMADPLLCAKQLQEALEPVIPGLTREDFRRAVAQGSAALEAFSEDMRMRSREILGKCARTNRPAVLVLGRPYHMDPGIGHEIETELQSHGFPVLWGQYLPQDRQLLDWLFGEDVRRGLIRSPLDISDVWRSSYSANTNELLWGAKFAAHMPWIACVIRFSSYECGMDQPTFTPVQAIVEGADTLFFSFQDLDANKPAGSIKIRTETIAHYLRLHSGRIIAQKLERMQAGHPFTASEAA